MQGEEESELLVASPGRMFETPSPRIDSPNVGDLREALYTRLKNALVCRRVLKAVRTLPRELYVPEGTPLDLAYGSRAVGPRSPAVGFQAWMADQTLRTLAPDDCPNENGALATLRPAILQLGFDYMYLTALLAFVFPHADIKALEPDATLGNESIRKHAASFNNVEARIGTGREEVFDMKFDAILITAAVVEILPIWKNALKVGGLLLAPVGLPPTQFLTKLTRTGAQIFQEQRLEETHFEPLIS